MRSSAATTVSRTRERIDSLRRRRRGRRVSAATPREGWRSVGTGIVFVVIFVSVEKVSRALRRAVAAAGGAVSAVGTEVAAAGNNKLHALPLFTLAAADAASFDRGHLGGRAILDDSRLPLFRPPHSAARSAGWRPASDRGAEGVRVSRLVAVTGVEPVT